MATRKFEKMNKTEQKAKLIQCLMLALQEYPAMGKQWKTDAYGIAAQYGKHAGVRKSDFDQIKKTKIDDLVKETTKKDKQAGTL